MYVCFLADVPALFFFFNPPSLPQNSEESSLGSIIFVDEVALQLFSFSRVLSSLRFFFCCNSQAKNEMEKHE